MRELKIPQREDQIDQATRIAPLGPKRTGVTTVLVLRGPFVTALKPQAIQIHSKLMTYDWSNSYLGYDFAGIQPMTEDRKARTCFLDYWDDSKIQLLCPRSIFSEKRNHGLLGFAIPNPGNLIMSTGRTLNWL